MKEYFVSICDEKKKNCSFLHSSFAKKIRVGNGCYQYVDRFKCSEMYSFPEIKELWVVNGVYPAPNRVAAIKILYPHSKLQQAIIVGLTQNTQFHSFQNDYSDDTMALWLSCKRFDAKLKVAYRKELLVDLLMNYTGTVYVAKEVYERFEDEFKLIVQEMQLQPTELQYGNFAYLKLQ